MGLSHSPTIVTDGLVLCLDAANARSYPGAGTTWTDRSANGNDGTLTNGPTFDSANGGSIVFDGTDDYAILGDDAPYEFVNTQPFSISCWVKLAADSGFTNIVAFAADGGQGYYIAIDYSVLRTNSFLFDYYDGLFWRGIQGNNNSIQIGSWINLTATSASNSVSDMKVYQNGVLTSYTNRGLANPASVDYSSIQLQIGARDNTYYIKGNIALLSMYNRDLSADEIRQNYNATKGRFQ